MKSRMIYIFLMLLTLLAICIGIDMRRNNKIYSQGEDMLQCRNSELRSYTKDVFINGEKINNERIPCLALRGRSCTRNLELPFPQPVSFP